MTSACNALCYQGIQRVYRNAVVRHLREEMTLAFGHEAVDKVRGTFSTKEWERIRSDAQSSRATGQLEAPIRDDFDLLGVNHFFNTFDKYWSELSEALPDDATERKRKQAVLGWMKEIKVFRDPLSHPAEADFTREDSFRLLDCSRRVLSSLGRADEAKEIASLIDQVLGRSDSDDMRPALDDCLPSKESVVVDFVGRERELDELRAWFDEPTSARWALAGEGGKGKSAIAYVFACQVKERAPEPFQTVLWLSAKKRRFVERVVAEIYEPDFQTLDTALSQLLVQFGWAEDVDLPLETRKARVLELLNGFPALVVVDDVDSLDEENEDAIEFFSFQAPRTRSKILLTSRRTVFGMGGSTTHVGGFSQDEAERFICSRCELLQLDQGAFTSSLIRQITKLTDGSPLYIDDLLRLSISTKSPGAALEMWKGREGLDARRYALERECELLTRKAKNILLACCVAPGSVSFSELASIVGLGDQDVAAALQDLQRLFLVPAPKFVEGEQRFGLNINTRTLVREVYRQTDEWRRVESAYESITKGLPAGGRSKVRAIIRQCGVLVRSKRWEEAETVMANALADRPGDPDLYGFSGWIYKSWEPPRLADARKQFARSRQLKCLKEDMYQHWAWMEMKQREWTKAASAAEEGLKLLPDSAVLSYLAGRARGQLSKELLGGLHQERASKEAGVAQRHLEHALASVRLEDRVSVPKICRALVLLFETLSDSKGITRFLRKWKRAEPTDGLLDWETQRLQDKFRTTFDLREGSG